MRLRSIICVCTLVLTGCREELGPEPMPTAGVVGKVHIRGRPIGHGWVEFSPVEGTIGLIHSAPIRPDGTFEADAVAVGTNTLAIAPRRSLPAGFHDLEQGGIIDRSIQQVPTNTLDIDLQDEIVQWLRQKSKAAEKPADASPGNASNDH